MNYMSNSFKRSGFFFSFSQLKQIKITTSSNNERFRENKTSKRENTKKKVQKDLSGGNWTT